MSAMPTVGFRLIGDSAIVTGGASGIGLAIVRHLLKAGVGVLIFDWKGAASTAARLNREGLAGRAVGFDGDVGDEANAPAAFDLAEREFGPTRMLCNVAAINVLSPIVGVQLADWNRIFNIDVTGTFLMTREFGRRFMERKLTGGAIINTTSINARIPTAGLAAYCSSKAAVKMLTEIAALEYAPLQVRVNALAPGLTETPLAEQFFANNPEVPAAFLKQLPMGRMGAPDDLARVATFLLSDAAGWITGLSVEADGGEHLMGVPDNWAVMKGPLGMKDPEPADWARG